MGIKNRPGSGNDPNARVQMFIDDVAYTGHVFAADNFETGNGSGGNGWGGSWTFTPSGSSTATVTGSGAPNSGSFHLQVSGNGAEAKRAVNLSGVIGARLIFDWKASGFGSGETAAVDIYDGTQWINVLTVSDGQDDDAYHHADISLSSYSLGSSFQVRFRSLMSDSTDVLSIDNLKIAR
jgi:hypothetical protein